MLYCFPIPLNKNKKLSPELVQSRIKLSQYAFKGGVPLHTLSWGPQSFLVNSVTCSIV